MLLGAAWLSAAGCSDVAFGVSTRGFDGGANIVLVFGQELAVAARLISSSGTAGRSVHTTVDLSGVSDDAALDVQADSVWLSAGAHTWSSDVDQVVQAEGTTQVMAAVSGPYWPAGTMVDVRVRLRRGDQVQDVDLTDQRLEQP